MRLRFAPSRAEQADGLGRGAEGLRIMLQLLLSAIIAVSIGTVVKLGANHRASRSLHRTRFFACDRAACGLRIGAGFAVNCRRSVAMAAATVPNRAAALQGSTHPEALRLRR